MNFFSQIRKTIQSYSSRDIFITKILAGFLALSVLVLFIATSIYNFKITNKDNEYTEVILSDFEGINPLFPQQNKANDDISYLAFEGLTRYNPETLQFEGNLADYQVNQDATVFTFILKNNLQWQDGEPITIDDVLFTYKNIFQHPQFPNQPIRDYFQNVQIEILAENQIQFKLPQSNAFFLSQTTLPILPKHVHKGIDISDLEVDSFSVKELLGSGPYQIKKIEEIENNLNRVTLKPNKYWRKGEPKIEQIEFLITSDENTAFSLQENVNTYSDLTPEQKSKISSTKFETENYTKSQYTALFLNTNNPTLRKLTIRQAIQGATDKKTIYDNFPDKKIVSLPIFQFQNIGQPGEANLEAVKNNLEDQGYLLNQNGFYQKETEELSFNLIAPLYESNPSKQAEIQKLTGILQNNYQKIGIQITPQLLSDLQFKEALFQKNYDMILIGQDLGKDFDLYPYWHSSQATEGRYNLANYNNPLSDALMENLRSTPDQNLQRQLIDEINQKIYDDSPAIFLYTDIHVFAFDNKVKNRKILSNYSSSPQRFFDIENWTLN